MSSHHAGLCSLLMKDDLWIAACAYTEFEFNKCMENLKLKSKSAYDYVISIKKETWSRHTFSLKSKVDLVVNDFCESFNYYILEARDKPVLMMMEWIRTSLMQRFQIKRDGYRNLQWKITLSAQRMLEVEKAALNVCLPAYVGNIVYQVSCSSMIFCVDLNKWSCRCKKWKLTGVPCKHSVAAIYI